MPRCLVGLLVTSDIPPGVLGWCAVRKALASDHYERSVGVAWYGEACEVTHHRCQKTMTPDFKA